MNPSRITYQEAVREALRDAIRQDERVVLICGGAAGDDGCFALSRGMMDEFGPERVRETPPAESGFLQVIEVMTREPSPLAANQILITAATLQRQCGGHIDASMVIRISNGGGELSAARHLHSLESWFADIPDITVLAPATLEDARGMLVEALKLPVPVLIFESEALCLMEGSLRDPTAVVDVSQARIMRPGRDMTVICHGAMLWDSLAAAGVLAGEGIEAEVLDLRVLRPLDDATIMDSVSLTHRVLIVDEGWRGGISAEISARIMEQRFFELERPVARLSTDDSQELPMDSILAAARELIHCHD